MNTPKIILQQIKAADPLALMAYGAKNFVGSEINDKNLGFLQFSVSGTRLYKQSVKVKISLEFNDTYTVEVYRVRGVKVNSLGKLENVYFDELVPSLDYLLEGKEY